MPVSMCGRGLVCLSTCGHGRGNRAPCASWAIRASMRPLAVYIYSFGPQSSAARRKLLRCARLRPRPCPRLAPLVEFGAVLAASSSLPFAARALPSQPSAIRSAALCRRDTAFLAPLAPRGVCGEPRPCVSLRSSERVSSLASPLLGFSQHLCNHEPWSL